MKEIVSILLPTYNGEKYIKQMLDSVLLQDYRPLEIIITDDASNDRTVAIINNWIKKLKMPNVSCKLIKSEENKGLSGNISNAVQYIHGKYLFFADQDDVWKKDKISSQVAYLEQNEDCVMCICDRSIMNIRNEVVCKSHFKYKNIDVRKRDYRKVRNAAKAYPANCMCLKTEHLDKVFPIPNQIQEHDFFIAIMAVHYGNIGYIKKPLTLWRIHDHNLSGQYALETNKSLIKAGFIIYRGLHRSNKKECLDPQIIKYELKRRFNEDISQWSPKLYSGGTKNLCVATIQYIFNNLDKWKRFCL